MLLTFVESAYDSPIVTLGIFSLLAAAAYLLPVATALLRNHHQKRYIIVLNVFAGWTILGWLAALVWASLKVETRSLLRKKKNLV